MYKKSTVLYPFMISLRKYVTITLRHKCHSRMHKQVFYNVSRFYVSLQVLFIGMHVINHYCHMYLINHIPNEFIYVAIV